MPSAGRARMGAIFRIEECHLPTNLLVLTTSPEAPQKTCILRNRKICHPDLKGARDPKPLSPLWNGPESVSWSFLHLFLSGLRAWRLCVRLSAIRAQFRTKAKFSLVPNLPHNPKIPALKTWRLPRSIFSESIRRPGWTASRYSTAHSKCLNLAVYAPLTAC